MFPLSHINQTTLITAPLRRGYNHKGAIGMEKEKEVQETESEHQKAINEIINIIF
jgi:hypothetical protein